MLLTAIIIGTLPSLIWLIFFLREDVHSEPKKMVAIVFLAGVLSVSLAIPLEFAAQGVLNSFGLSSRHFISFLILAAVEEIVKFLAAFWALKKRSVFFDEPVDAMIYMITAALGFAAAENVFVVLNNLFDGGGFNGVAGILILRFIGATLLHALSSGVVGYHWGRARAKFSFSPALASGLVSASLLHSFFNYLIIEFNETFVYSTVFLIILALFIFWDFEKLKAFARGRNQ